MHALMVSLGSTGDVLPYVALGRGLVDRGHEVLLAANEQFRGMIEGAGLGFTPVGTKEAYETAMRDPRLWHPVEAGRFLRTKAIEVTAEVAQVVTDHARPGKTVLLSSPMAMGSLLINERLGLPEAMIIVEPKMLFSVHHPLIGKDMQRLDWVPIWLRRFLVQRSTELEETMVKPVNEICERHDIPQIREPMLQWWRRPRRVIGLFPDWFAPYQEDWPDGTRLTGFLEYCAEDTARTPDELTAFLDSGPPPVVFSTTSFNKQGGQYFADVVQAVREIGCRAVLLTPHADQIPADLPDGARHFGFAPLSDILSRCAALVHTGGIGTLAQAVAAGIPQLLVPVALAQPDHAVRVADLQVGDYLSGAKFNSATLVAKLRVMLDDDTMRGNARRFGERMRGSDALGDSCALVEDLVSEAGL